MDDFLSQGGPAKTSQNADLDFLPPTRTIEQNMAPAAAPTNAPAPAGDDIFGAPPPTAQPPPAAIPLGAPVAAQQPEVNALREWEKTHDVELEKLAQQEIAEKKKTRDAAQKDLEQFYNTRKTNISKKKELNRKEEQQWIKMREDQNAKGGNTWEKVATLIEEQRPEVPEKPLTPRKPDPTSSTTRMKSLLISVKSKPPN